MPEKAKGTYDVARDFAISCTELQVSPERVGVIEAGLSCLCSRDRICRELQHSEIGKDRPLHRG